MSPGGWNRWHPACFQGMSPCAGGAGQPRAEKCPAESSLAQPGNTACRPGSKRIATLTRTPDKPSEHDKQRYYRGIVTSNHQTADQKATRRSHPPRTHCKRPAPPKPRQANSPSDLRSMPPVLRPITAPSSTLSPIQATHTIYPSGMTLILCRRLALLLSGPLSNPAPLLACATNP